MRVHPKLTEFLLVAWIAALCVVILLLCTDLMTTNTKVFHGGGDHHSYRSMSSTPWLSTHYAPWGWRILVPYIAKALPIANQNGFLLVCALSLTLTGVLLYYLGRALHFRVPLALAATMLFFTVGWATKFLVFDFWLPDAAAFAFITACLLCVVTRRDLWFLALLAVGVAAKESVIFVAPLFYTLRAERLIDWRLAVRTVAVTLPAIVVLFGIRVVLGQSGHYGYARNFARIGARRLEHFSFPDMWNGYLHSYGILLALLPMITLVLYPKMVLRLLPFMALIGSQLLFALNIYRLTTYGFPAMIVLSLMALGWMATKWRLNPWYFLAAPVLIFLAEQASAFRRPAPLAVQAGIVAVCVLLLLVVKLFKLERFHATEYATERTHTAQ